MTSVRDRIAKIPLAVHGYRLVKVVGRDPLNRGSRAKYAYQYLKWFGFQRPTGRRTIAQLQNGLQSWVYPDSDSGVSYLFTRNVDYYDDQFVRRTLEPGDFIVDAGCNVGNRLLALADIIGGGLVLDANPLCIERLVENLELNNVDPDRYHRVAKAVGAAVGTLQFSDMGATDCSNRIVDDPSKAVGPMRTVPVTTIDVEMSALGNPACAYIKLDLEGHDLEGLEGARQTLGQDHMRLVKFERWQTTPLEPITAFFAEIGWALFALDDAGEPTLNPATLGRAANLFAMPQARWDAAPS